MSAHWVVVVVVVDEYVVGLVVVVPVVVVVRRVVVSVGEFLKTPSPNFVANGSIQSMTSSSKMSCLLLH